MLRVVQAFTRTVWHAELNAEFVPRCLKSDAKEWTALLFPTKQVTHLS
jgi:hypothetical protein